MRKDRKKLISLINYLTFSKKGYEETMRCLRFINYHDREKYPIAYYRYESLVEYIDKLLNMLGVDE